MTHDERALQLGQAAEALGSYIGVRRDENAEVQFCDRSCADRELAVERRHIRRDEHARVEDRPRS